MLACLLDDVLSVNVGSARAERKLFLKATRLRALILFEQQARSLKVSSPCLLADLFSQETHEVAVVVEPNKPHLVGACLCVRYVYLAAAADMGAAWEFHEKDE